VIEGGLAHFECTLRKEYIEGDHVIIVGAVESGGVAQEQTPLIYFRGRYHSARPD
jgi:flavin reductase (DIM6/NTAB) family NADH-FMN oxidoreductase RutF